MGYFGDIIRELGIGNFIKEFGDVFLEDIISEFENFDERRDGDEQLQRNGVIRLKQSKRIDEEIAAKTISRAYGVISTCAMIEDILKGV